MRAVIACLLIIFSNVIYASEKPELTFVAELQQGLTNADGTGTYWQIIKAIYQQDYQLNLIVTDISQAKKMLSSGVADGIVGIYKGRESQFLYPDSHINMSHPYYAVYNDNKHMIGTMADIAGLTIAGKKGADFNQFIPSDIRFYHVEQDEKSYALLNKDRVDAAIVPSFNLNSVNPNKQFAQTKVINKKPIYVAFQTNFDGELLKRKFQQQMLLLKQTDALQKIYSDKLAFQYANFDHKDPRQIIELSLIAKLFSPKYKRIEAVSDEINFSLRLDELSDEFTFNYQIQNTKAALEQMKSKDNVCVLNINKSEQREAFAIYSKPSFVYLPPKLFTLANNALTINDSHVSIKALINQEPNILIAFSERNNFEKSMKNSLGEPLPSNLSKVSGDPFTQIDLLQAERVDAFIAWPVLYQQFNHNFEIKKPMTSLKIDEQFNQPSYTYLACSKSEIGQAMINHFNKLMSNHQSFDSLIEPILKTMDNNSKSEFVELLKKANKTS